MLMFRNLRSLAFPQKFSHLFTWAKWKSRSLGYRSSQSLRSIVKMRNQCLELVWAPYLCKNNSMYLVAHKKPNKGLFAIYIYIHTHTHKWSWANAIYAVSVLQVHHECCATTPQLGPCLYDARIYLDVAHSCKKVLYYAFPSILASVEFVSRADGWARRKSVTYDSRICPVRIQSMHTSHVMCAHLIL